MFENFSKIRKICWRWHLRDTDREGMRLVVTFDPGTSELTARIETGTGDPGLEVKAA